jgi:A/G-specific adenine glycosylase
VPVAQTVPSKAREAILSWHAANGRRLAFRGSRDPYAILVSEAMSQQTQAARAAEHWQRFIARFPTVVALAAASPADVQREWRGLGYNRRALALWRAARMIESEYGGKVPDKVEALEILPGVGPYTARAVAAIAFGQPVGAVDVNTRRVLGRMLFGRGDSIGPKRMQGVADASVPAGRVGDWTHALMDIGATLCRPVSPRCGECPARTWCRYAAEGVVGRRGRGHAKRAGRQAVSFPATNRWLRGRILDRLRAAHGDRWVMLDGPIGIHDPRRVATAAIALADEGLIEVAPRATGEGALRARLTMS